MCKACHKDLLGTPHFGPKKPTVNIKRIFFPVGLWQLSLPHCALGDQIKIRQPCFLLFPALESFKDPISFFNWAARSIFFPKKLSLKKRMNVLHRLESKGNSMIRKSGLFLTRNSPPQGLKIEWFDLPKPNPTQTSNEEANVCMNRKDQSLKLA